MIFFNAVVQEALDWPWHRDCVRYVTEKLHLGPLCERLLFLKAGTQQQLDESSLDSPLLGSGTAESFVRGAQPASWRQPQTPITQLISNYHTG